MVYEFLQKEVGFILNNVELSPLDEKLFGFFQNLKIPDSFAFQKLDTCYN